MLKIYGRIVFVGAVLFILTSGNTWADTGYIGPGNSNSSSSPAQENSNPSTSISSSNNTTASNSSSQASSAQTTTSSNASDNIKNTGAIVNAPVVPTPGTKETTNKTQKPVISPQGGSPNGPNNTPQEALPTNVQSDSVSVEPFSGSANLSFPIQLPPGRGGIHPSVVLLYSSSNRALGLMGVGWNLDLGSIKISTKYGIPKYDGTDSYILDINGISKNLVYDSQNDFYREDVEGTFSRIQQEGNGWVLTDKNGVSYFYGQTDDSRLSDPNNSTHVYQWALNRVEDMNGNYMTITYTNDQGQIYPDTINYTGNDQDGFTLNPYAQVKFSYQANSIAFNSNLQGFSVTTGLRLNAINVSVLQQGAYVPQASYALSYITSPDTGRDLLQTIVQTGADGSTLPTTTFNYQNNNGAFVKNYTANNSSQTDKILLGDFNGDGYMDMADYSPTTGTVEVALGNSSGTFGTQSSWLTGAPLNQTVIPIDVNGDGKTDLVFYDPTSGNWTVAYSNGSSFSAPVALQNNWGTGEAVGMADFNGDGKGDLYMYKIVNGKIFARIMIQQADGTFQDMYNQDIPIGNAGDIILTGDFNGDGLTDFCAFTPSTGQWSVTYNSGNYVQGFISGPVITGFGANQNPILGDFNGDGKIKIGYVDSTGKINYRSVDTSTVTTSTFSLSNISNAFQYQGINLTQDGLTDIFDSNSAGNWEEVLNGNTPTDLLISVNNGLGAQTNIVYDAAEHAANTYLPFFIPVVKSISKTVDNPADPLTESYTTNYSYSNGLWDPIWREFDGFKNVTVTDQEGNYTVTTYFQDHYTKGQISEQDAYSAKGILFNKVENDWQTQDIATDSTRNIVSEFVYLARVDKYTYLTAASNQTFQADIVSPNPAPSATVKRSAQSHSYGEDPQYGDLTQTINYGEVDPQTGKPLDLNEEVTNNEYVYNTDDWIILPKHTYIQDIHNKIVSQTWDYYDDEEDNNAQPELGELTKKVNWLNSIAQPDPVTSYSYDAYGNQLTVTDPNGNTTTTTYDNDVYVFPVQRTNALDQTASTSLYGIAGVALNNNAGLQGLWGQTMSATDLNDQTTYTTFDGFGRPLLTISPLDTAAFPTIQKVYNLNSNYIQILTKSLVNSGETGTVDKADFYDGLGRLIETKTEAGAVYGATRKLNLTDGGPLPPSTEYIVSGLTAYDVRGLAIKKYLPSFTANDLNTIDILDTTKNIFTNNTYNIAEAPFAQTTYDAIGRETTKTNPDGTYSSTAYNLWTTTKTDENGHKHDEIVDGFGRLIEKIDYTGSDGRDSKDYPASAYSLYASTNYNYDVLGNLISVTDAYGNVTSIQYDPLGHKTAMNDPDMGKWQYSYDENGNIISQTDANGKTIRFSYDQLNRLLDKTDGIPTGPINNFPNLPPVTPTFNEQYTYDSTASQRSPGIKFPINPVLTKPIAKKPDLLAQNDSLLDKLLGVQKAYAQSSPNCADDYITSYLPGSGTWNVIMTPTVTFTWGGGQCVTESHLMIGTTQGGSNIYNGYTTGKSATVNNIPLNDNATIYVELVSQLNGSWYTYEQYSNPPNVLNAQYFYYLTNQPIVALTTPAAGACYSAPANIVLTATEMNTTRLTSVAFNNGSTVLNQASNPTPPITDSLINVPVGTYNFSVTASGVITIPWGGGTITASIPMTTNPTTVNVIPYQAPTVSLSDTINGNEVNFTASAVAGSCQSISKVEFYNGTTLIGTATSSPYTFAWNNVANGAYAITAEVYSVASSGSAPVTATSTPITVNVTPTPPSLVTLTVQDTNGNYMAPDNISLTAIASKSGATITKVDFYNSSSLLGTISSNPYTFTWSNVAAGNYTLTAVATFSDGTTSESSNVYVNLRQPSRIPMVSLTLPENNSTFDLPATITLTANATEDGGTINQVAFYNGKSLLGTVTSSPYTFVWNNVEAGQYSLSAVATDSNGNTSTSPVVLATVQSILGNNPSNSVGHLSQETYDGVGQNVYSYDVLGRLNQIDKTINGVTYSIQKSYNAMNNISLITYPDGEQVNYTYNSAGQIFSIGDAGGGSSANSYIAGVNYNASGQVTEIVYGNGVSTTYAYDPRSLRILQIRTSNSKSQESAIQDLNYTYDAAGQVTSITDKANSSAASMTQTFAYDALNRLVSASGIYGNKTYVYDAIGNILQKDGNNYLYGQSGGRIDGTKAGPHAVTSINEGSVSVFKYDDNGNMVTITKGAQTTSYNYDVQNRLQSVSAGGLVAANYEYDNDGNRVQKTVFHRNLALYNDNVNAFLFNNPTTSITDTTVYVDKIYEYESRTDGTTRGSNFIYAGPTRVAESDGQGNVFYYHHDHLGGTNMLTDVSGLVRELTEYDPYGQVFVHETSGDTFINPWYYYTDKPLDDESGLIYLGARYYNPVIGRMITPDTEVPAPDNPQTFNRYTYCNNNPVNLIDPTGHTPSNYFYIFGNKYSVSGAVVGGISGGIGDAIAAGVILGPDGALIGFAWGFAGGFVSGAGGPNNPITSTAGGIVQGLPFGFTGVITSGATGFLSSQTSNSNIPYFVQGGTLGLFVGLAVEIAAAKNGNLSAPVVNSFVGLVSGISSGATQDFLEWLGQNNNSTAGFTFTDATSIIAGNNSSSNYNNNATPYYNPITGNSNDMTGYYDSNSSSNNSGNSDTGSISSGS